MKLKEARESAGLTQEQAAREAGLTLNTLRKLEAGRASRNTGYGTVLDVCRVVGVDPGEVEEFVRMGEKEGR